MYYPVLTPLLQADPVHQRGFERNEQNEKSKSTFQSPNNYSKHPF